MQKCIKIEGDTKGDIIFTVTLVVRKNQSGVRAQTVGVIENFFKQTPWRDRMTFDIPRSLVLDQVLQLTQSMNGVIRFMVDAVAAPRIVDFERLTTLEGTAGRVNQV